MNELEKLLKKAVEKDRRKILAIMHQLRSGKTKGLEYQKLKKLNFYKIRVGKYRIIFSFNKNKTIKIEVVRLRNEKTYVNSSF
ncbi:type II toxin-antitoxin system RelE/ParE family toxin [bacterium]|nr:type II toxin-antitoxin system RelE/ParE family toxin [bacterium]